MLGLPKSTEVNRRVAKDKLYANANFSSSLKDQMKNQVESITWRNKLAESTMGVAAGDSIKEIQVFEIKLRQGKLDNHILQAITKAIPYKILFLLTYQDKLQAWMEVEGTFYSTSWHNLENLDLKFVGLNLDVLHENLARQIAGGRLDIESDMSEAVRRDKERTQIERDIVRLEKKILQEKQFNRQVELNRELKRLRDKLRRLHDQ